MRKLRERLGITQEEVAARSGGLLQRTYVSGFESGRNAASTIAALQGLAKAFGVSVVTLQEYLEGRAALSDVAPEPPSIPERAKQDAALLAVADHAIATYGKDRPRPLADDNVARRRAAGEARLNHLAFDEAIEAVQRGSPWNDPSLKRMGVKRWILEMRLVSKVLVLAPEPVLSATQVWDRARVLGELARRQQLKLDEKFAEAMHHAHVRLEHERHPPPQHGAG